jgi:hypothetical protein
MRIDYETLYAGAVRAASAQALTSFVSRSIAAPPNASETGGLASCSRFRTKMHDREVLRAVFRALTKQQLAHAQEMRGLSRENACGLLRRHFELGQRHVREREEHIARQREIVARLEHLREPATLQMARDLLRKMEHAQMLHVAERERLRELLGD